MLISNSAVNDVSGLYTRLNPSVVEVSTVAGRFGGGVGSGIVLDLQGDILTNYHVVSSATRINVKLWDGTSGTATVVGTNPNDDLAVIKLSGSTSRITFKPLPEDDPKVRRPDIDRATHLLGWTPKISLEEGLGRTIEYFRSKLVRIQ